MMNGKSASKKQSVLLRSKVVSDGSSEEWHGRLGRLNLHFQSKVCGRLRRNVTQTSDRDSGKHTSEVLCIKELSKIPDCRRAREGDAVSAARKHRCHSPSIQVLRQSGAINRNHIDARACRCECFW